MGGIGIGLAGDLLLQPHGQLSTEDGGQTHLGGGMGEPHRTVETVVIGQRQGRQPRGRTRGHELLRVGGPVEEAELGVHMQLGPLDGRSAQNGPWPGPEYRPTPSEPPGPTET